MFSGPTQCVNTMPALTTQPIGAVAMAGYSSPISRVTGKPITPEMVRELLDYDSDTGVLTWRVDRGHFPCAGMPAGGRSSHGRINVKLDGRLIAAHRIIWAHVTGAWPIDEIDHRDGNPGNNRFANLREATRPQNCQNTRFVRRNSSSGHKGVSYRKECGKWRARIAVNGKHIVLGVFASKDEAIAAYCAASAELHGEFARRV